MNTCSGTAVFAASRDAIDRGFQLRSLFYSSGEDLEIFVRAFEV